MTDYKFTDHALDMLYERKIKEEWVWETIKAPGKIENKEDNTIHYTKKFYELNNRSLRVIINQNTIPKRIVTVFFDRRLRKNQ